MMPKFKLYRISFPSNKYNVRLRVFIDGLKVVFIAPGLQMKNRLLWILLTLALVTLGTALATPQLEPRPDQAQAAHLSAEVLARHHYKHSALDDAMSSAIFDNYLKALDSEKVFFLQSDISLFTPARTALDDAILRENLRAPYAIFNRYQQSIEERINYALALLGKGFDFTEHESYQFSRKNATWPQTENELNELWRKRVKNDWLRLKLAGKDDKAIRDTLSKRYEKMLSGLSKINGDDVFQYFMNAYTTSIDPHTSYFGRRAAEEFDISMKLSLVGIGAVLQEKDEYTIIRELVAGGPALLSGKLKAGDRIVGVGQGKDGVIAEVMGWRLDDTVALIRGAEDSIVLLDVLPAEAGPDGEHKIISLVRKKVSLDKQAAKKSIIEVKEGNTIRHIGVISLPGFYQDFAAHQRGDKNFKSATRDVSRLLDELKKENVDSVLMDLRNNGGGSLTEAIELTGLFIDKGPVVQQRDSSGKISVENDTRDGLAWDGPLGVLINRASASASEIFAAAIQDYGRGVIIGEPSFGKGTVQSVVDLDQLVSNAKPEFGELKMTIAQFFRINGGTTQLRGVTPDISFPSQSDTSDFGESSFDNALPWTKIKAAAYIPAGDLSGILPSLKTNHDARVSKDKDFQYLIEDITEANLQRKKNLISLNEAERRKERQARDAKIKLHGNTKAIAASNLAARQDDGLQSNERNLDTDLAFEKSQKNSKDVLLNEAVHILNDEVGLLQRNPKFAASVSGIPKPGLR
jgi:carboxyl-terminal processing protease